MSEEKVQVTKGMRGGPREGAGRPTMFGNGRMLRGSFTVPSGYLEFLRDIGGESTVSSGIRLAVQKMVEDYPKAAEKMREIKDNGFDIGNLAPFLEYEGYSIETELVDES